MSSPARRNIAFDAKGVVGKIRKKRCMVTNANIYYFRFEVLSPRPVGPFGKGPRLEALCVVVYNAVCIAELFTWPSI